MGEVGEEGVLVDLQTPGSDRQILATGDREWRVDINVNSGNSQTFYFGSVDSPLVSVTGIRPGESNFVAIKWTEIVNGIEVEISDQEDSFIADGNTRISTTHRHSQYDYDGDGTSNLNERSGGTCVWFPNEDCINPGQLDIPTDNLLLNGDFSNGGEYWFSTGGEQRQVQDEFCAATPASAQFYWETNVGYTPRLTLDANTSYRITFDVRADRNSKVYVVMAPANFEFNLVDENFDVSTTYAPISLLYESANSSYNDISFTFSIGDGTDNRFCFDNVKLIRTGSN